MVVAVAPTRPAVRDRVLSMLAGPFFAIGWVAQTVAIAAVWCAAAFMLGTDAARERWKRAG